MKVSMSTLRGTPLEQSLDLAYEAGYDGVEILADHFLACTNPAKIIEKIKSYPLNKSMHASAGDINITSSNEGIRQESIRQVKATIDLCKELGIKLLTLHPGRLSSARDNRDIQKEKQIEALGQIADYAKASQVYICLENMEKRSKEVVNSLEDLSTIIHLVNNEYLGGTIDLAHLYTAGIEKIEKVDFPIYNVHVSQCVSYKPHYALGHTEGQINIKRHLETLQPIYNGQFVIEVKGKLTKEDLKMNLVEFRRLIALNI